MRKIENPKEIDLYQSIKKVRAFKIFKVKFNKDRTQVAIFKNKEDYILEDSGYIIRNPELSENGYYVIYEIETDLPLCSSYSPIENFELGYTNISSKENIKSLNSSDTNHVTKLVPDIKKFGNPDLFRLICKASSESEGWMKSTKAMEITGCGVLVQVTTQQDSNIAEATSFIPNARIKEIKDENNKVIERRIVHTTIQ